MLLSSYCNMHGEFLLYSLLLGRRLFFAKFHTDILIHASSDSFLPFFALSSLIVSLISPSYCHSSLSSIFFPPHSSTYYFDAVLDFLYISDY